MLALLFRLHYHNPWHLCLLYDVMIRGGNLSLFRVINVLHLEQNKVLKIRKYGVSVILSALSL